MTWLTLAMLAYPEMQARAHAELDAVVGRSHLPTFADLPHVSYTRAMVKEALRWRPLSPSGPPHQTTEDDWYEETFISKGTVCIPNVWHLNRDPEIFGKNPEHFDPARHLDASRDTAPGISGAFHVGIWAQNLRRSLHGRQRALHQHCGLLIGVQNRSKERRIRQLRSFGFG